MSGNTTQFKIKILSLVTFILFAVSSGSSQEGQLPGAADFEKRCYSCHNIGGGDKKGPDLKGATERRSKQWLHEFVISPQAMNRKGDGDANALFKKFSPEVMPDQPLTPEQIDGIITLIDTLTKRNEPFVPSGAKLARPMQPGDIDAGHQLFTGRTKMNNGGAACISCHSVTGSARLGGGTLGPDLTAVNLKYRDPELISIMQNPNFPTMKSVFGAHPFTDEEIVKLFAYFQNAKLTNPTAQVQPTVVTTPPVNIWFPVIGFAALLLAYFGINRMWKNRLRGVREDLVRRSKR